MNPTLQITLTLDAGADLQTMRREFDRAVIANVLARSGTKSGDCQGARGSHLTREDGLCLMEAAAMLAGEGHGDNPQCVAPTIRTFGIGLNDMMNDAERVQLEPYVHKVVGTAYDECLAESEQRRAFLCADYAVRVFAPIKLREDGRTRDAERLESLSPIVDKETARTARIAASGAAWWASETASHAASHTSRASLAALNAFRAARGAASNASREKVIAAAMECFRRMF